MKKDTKLIAENLVFQFSIELAGSVYSTVMPEYLKKQNAGISVFANLNSLYAIVLLLSAPFFGKLSDKVGRKIFIVLGLLVYSIVNFGYFAFENVYLYALFRVLMALFVANGITIASASLMDGISDGAKTYAVTLAGASIGLGYTIGPFITNLMLNNLGLTYPFLVSAFVLLGMFVYFLFFTKEVTEVKEKHVSLKKSIQWFWDEKIGYILILSFLSTFAYELYKTPFNYFLNEEYGYNLNGISQILGLSGVVLLIYQLVLANFIFKKFGERKVILFTSILSMLAIYLFTKTNYIVNIILIHALIMIAIDACIRSASISLIGKITPNEKAYILGLRVSAFCLGSTVAPIISSYLYKINKNYPYYLGALLFLIAVIYWFTWDKHFKEEIRRRKMKNNLANE